MGSTSTVFIALDEVSSTDAPVYIPGCKNLGGLTIPSCLRPGDVFLPLMEGKWIYQFDGAGNAFVAGGGSYVVTRPRLAAETDIIPHYFMARLDADRRTPRIGETKFAFRDVARWVGERTMIAASVPARFPCGHNLPIMISDDTSNAHQEYLLAIMNSFIIDFVARLISSVHITRDVKCKLTVPYCESFAEFTHVNSWRLGHLSWQGAEFRALLESMVAELFELTPGEFAHLLTTFPLLDRDQPPIPGDYRIRASNKGIDRRKQSFVTRDLALLTYFDYLAGRLDAKPDPGRVSRICPEGVPEVPKDIIAMFSEAGIDIAGTTDRAVAQTGPIRDLRARVALARELGAVAYIPTLDRRRAPFVEHASEAGGLHPADGVLTPEMARRVLRDKAERDARWQRAMMLWESTMNPGPSPELARPTDPLEAVPPTATR